MIDGQDYKRLLHSHRMKSTKPRNAVLSVLGEKDCVLTAEEIYRALVQKGDGVNFSTVYRVLELFAEKRLVTKTFFSDSRSYGFSLKTAEHMHHLICMKCHKRSISHIVLWVILNVGLQPKRGLIFGAIILNSSAIVASVGLKGRIRNRHECLYRRTKENS